MRFKFWRKGRADGEIDTYDSLEFRGDYTDVMGTIDIQFPHCDSLILHSPGACEFCDRHPDWQRLRSAQGIAFSDMSEADRVKNNLLPCPSEARRAPEVRDLWNGNKPTTSSRFKPGFMGRS